MSPRSTGRIATCSPAQALSRRRDAQELLLAARATPGDTPESRKADAHYSPGLISVATAQQVPRSAAILVEAAVSRT